MVDAQTQTKLINSVQRVNTATLLMGVTGSGKTSLLKTFFEYVWDTYHKVTAFNTCDGGAFPTTVQWAIKVGIARVWRMRTRSADGLVFETCYEATRGYLPRRIDPRTGEVEPNVELVPPIRTTYEMLCPNGHLVKSVPSQQLLTAQVCPKCKTPTTLQNGTINKKLTQTKGFEQIGAYAFDGLTSMCAWMINDLGQRAGRLELKGEEAAIGGKVISGNRSFGGSTRSHVGFTQERVAELVTNSLSIPNLVASPIFTALTMEALDDGNLSIIGPKLAGKAKADEAPAWFGNVLESAVVSNEKGERVRRLYLSEFTDAAGNRHLLKNSGSGALPPYVEDPPENPQDLSTQFTGFNLGSFFRMLDQDLVEAMKVGLDGAPGMPEGIVEFGDGPAAAPAAQPAQSTAPAAPAPTAQTQPATPAAPAAPAAPAPKPRGNKPAAQRAQGEQPAASPAPAAPAAAQQTLPVEAAPAAPPATAQPSAPAPAGAASQAPRTAAPPPAAPRPPAAAPRLPPRK